MAGISGFESSSEGAPWGVATFKTTSQGTLVTEPSLLRQMLLRS
jgi:hypothetical protein